MVGRLGLHRRHFLYESHLTIQTKLGPAEASGGGSAPVDVFVGRDRELSALSRSALLALSCQGGLSLVYGEPGIGKSRLAHEVSCAAQNSGMRVLWGRCWEGEGASAFWPWEQIVRQYAGTVSHAECVASLGHGAVHVVRAIPGICESVPTLARQDASEETPAARFRFFDAFYSFLKRLSEEQPTLILLDDLHSADDGSLLLLQFLASQIRESSIALLATYRDIDIPPKGTLSQVLAAISRHPWTHRCPLGGLGFGDVAQLLSSIIGGNADKSLAEALYQLTEGNPFFLRELAVQVVKGTEIHSAGQLNEWRAILPQTVRQMILDEWERLSPNCRDTLTTAAVIGREFDLKVLSLLTNSDRLQLSALLSDAIERRIIARMATGDYRFHHALVREVVYESTPAPLRARLHSEIAATIVHNGGLGTQASPSMLAHHYYMALPFVDVSVAMDAALNAGVEAQRRLAYEEAAMHFQRGLDLSRTAIDRQRQCAFMNCLGEAQAGLGLWAESRVTFGVAANEARSLGDGHEFVRAAIGFKGMMGATTPVDFDAVRLLRTAAESFPGQDPRLLVRVLSALSRSLYFGRVPDEVKQYSKKALKLARSLGEDELYLVALDAHLTSIWGPDHLEEFFSSATELLQRAIGVDNKEMAFNAHLYRYYCLATWGKFNDGAIELGWADRLASETRNVRCSWQVPMIRAARMLVRGDFDESERLSSDGQRLGGLVHDSSPTHHYMAQMFQRARVRGTLSDVDAAMAIVDESFPDVVGYRAALALYLANRGEKTRARSILCAAAENGFSDVTADFLSLWVLTVFAEAAYLCGEGEWNRPLYDRLSRYGNLNIVMGWGSAYDGAVSQYLGLLSAAMGDCDAALGHLRNALVRNGASDCVPLFVRTRYYMADVLLRFGADDVLGFEILDECVAEFRRLGMPGFLALSARARAPSTRPIPRAVVDPSFASKDAGRIECMFRRELGFWTIGFGGRVLRLKHCRGLALIATLLRRPDMDIHVLDLIGAAEPREAVAKGVRREVSAGLGLGDAGPLLDEQARAEYRQRVEECRAELAAAEECNDIGRSEALRRELAFLEAELARAYGRNGRARVAAAAAERARVRIRNNVTAALRMIRRAEGGELVWRHLEGAIRTGTVCSYRPERPVSWVF